MIERKTTLEILNGRITEAHGHISVKYAKTTLNKVWLSFEGLQEELDCMIHSFGEPNFDGEHIVDMHWKELSDKIYLALTEKKELMKE